MENNEILTNDVVEVTEEIVTETGIGTGGKVRLALLVGTALGLALKTGYDYIKNKKAEVAAEDELESDVDEEVVADDDAE